MNIDSYSFGRIVIGGREFTSDVLISPKGVKANWWRAHDHDIALFDLGELIRMKPKILIIGTGASGVCKVLPEVVAWCRSSKVELIVKTTPEAVAEYNIIEDKSSVVVAIHITC